MYPYLENLCERIFVYLLFQVMASEPSFNRLIPDLIYCNTVNNLILNFCTMGRTFLVQKSERTMHSKEENRIPPSVLFAQKIK